MKGQKPKVLFFSTGNATRSLIAEGFLRNLTGDRFDVASAAVAPSALNPLAAEVMKEAGIDISGQKPKSLKQSVKERFGYVIAICDTAKLVAKGACPASAGNGKWRPSVNINGENACERNESITVQTRR